MLLPDIVLKPDAGFQQNDYWVWCGSAIRGEDGFHMYAARWSKQYPMFSGYIYHSEIVHAYSPTADGKYQWCKTVAPIHDPSRWDGRMAHNPTIVKYLDQYLLFYIGSTYHEIDPPVENSALQQEIYNRIRIGVAISDSPAGPWHFLDHPLLEPCPGSWDSTIVTNPAPCVLPDGRIFLYYRSNTPDGLRIGLAVAECPEGPFHRIGYSPILQFDVEDPFVWYHNRSFHMIAKDMTGTITGELHAGGYFKSENGVDWHYADKAYSRRIQDESGNPLHLGCLERPQLVFDHAGDPEFLFAAVADGPGGFCNASYTWNAAINLKKSE